MRPPTAGRTVDPVHDAVADGAHVNSGRIVGVSRITHQPDVRWISSTAASTASNSGISRAPGRTNRSTKCIAWRYVSPSARARAKMIIRPTGDGAGAVRSGRGGGPIMRSGMTGNPSMMRLTTATMTSDVLVRLDKRDGRARRVRLTERAVPPPKPTPLHDADNTPLRHRHHRPRHGRSPVPSRTVRRTVRPNTCRARSRPTAVVRELMAQCVDALRRRSFGAGDVFIPQSHGRSRSL